MTPMETMIKARAGLITSKIFFGALAMRLKLVEDPNIGTMATDGVSLLFSPDFLKRLTPPELLGVVAHEVMHCVLLHATRRGNRDPKLWNIAADYVVNPILIADKFVLPEDKLEDKAYYDMSTDQVYEILERKYPPKPTVYIVSSDNSEDSEKGDGSSSNQRGGEANDDGPEEQGWGGVEDAPDKDAGGNDISSEELEGQWKVALEQASKQAKAAGKLPAQLERLVKTITHPQVCWKTVLRNFLTQPMKNDYSWTRPNRRHIANGLYLPSLYSEGMGEMVFAVDTSGSITDDTLTQFGAELNAVLEDVQPTKLTVLYVDTKVAEKDVEVFYPEDLPIKLKNIGGGGTEFDPPFKWIDEQGEMPAAFVYLTDMYGDCTVDDPPYPVLWVTVSQVTDAPFGRVIKMYEN